jgi:hypothetical protein
MTGWGTPHEDSPGYFNLLRLPWLLYLPQLPGESPCEESFQQCNSAGTVSCDYVFTQPERRQTPCSTQSSKVKLNKYNICFWYYYANLHKLISRISCHYWKQMQLTSWGPHISTYDNSTRSTYFVWNLLEWVQHCISTSIFKYRNQSDIKTGRIDRFNRFNSYTVIPISRTLHVLPLLNAVTC